MTSSFIGEVRAFPYSFVPQGWLDCAGQELPILQYQALAAVIGNIYGGDGRTKFQLPDLRGRAALGQSQAPEMTNYPLGQAQGVASVTLTQAHLPSHNHRIITKNIGMSSAPNAFADTPTPQAYPSRLVEKTASPAPVKAYAKTGDITPMSPAALSTVPHQTEASPHENRQPYTALRFCICFDGEFPIYE